MCCPHTRFVFVVTLPNLEEGIDTKATSSTKEEKRRKEKGGKRGKGIDNHVNGLNLEKQYKFHIFLFQAKIATS